MFDRVTGDSGELTASRYYCYYRVPGIYFDDRQVYYFVVFIIIYLPTDKFTIILLCSLLFICRQCTVRVPVRPESIILQE